MGFALLAVRAPGEGDASLFPALADAGTVATESLDGERKRLLANGVVVRERTSAGVRTLLKVPNVKIEVLISDSRVVVACSKFEKGGGWWGIGGAGVAIALTADVVSKARAAHRRHGKMLVGQVRYPWLHCVGFKPKQGFGTAEELRLGVVEKSSDGAVRELFLDLLLPSNVDSAAVAREVATRAGRYRVAHWETADEEEKALYERLAQGPAAPTPQPKQFGVYELPRFAFVSAASAYPQAAVKQETLS